MANAEIFKMLVQTRTQVNASYRVSEREMLEAQAPEEALEMLRVEWRTVRDELSKRIEALQETQDN